MFIVDWLVELASGSCDGAGVLQMMWFCCAVFMDNIKFFIDECDLVHALKVAEAASATAKHLSLEQNTSSTPSGSRVCA